MDTTNDADYYLRREQQAREMASRATDPSIAAIHRDLAELYASIGRAAAHRERQALRNRRR